MAHDAQHGVNVAECLDLANFLEALPPEKFDMREWCGTAACIGGWQARRLGFKSFGRAGAGDAVAASLGIDFRASDKLFCVPSGPPLRDITIPQAARVLRHLAATGKVDWSVAL